MAVSNRDRIGKMFEAIAPALDDYIATVIGAVDPAVGAEWIKLIEALYREAARWYMCCWSHAYWNMGSWGTSVRHCRRSTNVQHAYQDRKQDQKSKDC